MTAPQVREIMEEMIRKLWLHILNVDLGDFPIMTFDEAMRRYGSDKPDLRLPMELVDVADLLTAVEFAVFAGPANDPKGRVAALKVPGGAELSRKQIDEYTKFVGIYGAKGLAWMKVNEVANGIEGYSPRWPSSSPTPSCARSWPAPALPTATSSSSAPTPRKWCAMPWAPCV